MKAFSFPILATGSWVPGLLNHEITPSAGAATNGTMVSSFKEVCNVLVMGSTVLLTQVAAYC